MTTDTLIDDLIYWPYTFAALVREVDAQKAAHPAPELQQFF